MTNKETSKTKACLLIDDDEDDQEIFSLALTEADATIAYFTAKDGIEALNMLKDASFIPDYIFLDLNMPFMNGKECLAEIKKLEHLKHIPLIIFSTSASEKDIADTMQLGAHSFIKKPASISALTSLLTDFFKNYPSLDT